MSRQLVISDFEATKMQVVTGATQSFFLYRLGENVSTEIDLDADSKLFIMENIGLNVSQMPPGQTNSSHFGTSTLLPDGNFSESESSIYRPNNLDLPARIRLPGMKEDFGPRELLMVIWSEARGRVGLLNLSSISEAALPDVLRSFLKGEARQPATVTSVDTVNPEPSAPLRTKAQELIGAMWARSYGGSLSAESPTSQSLPDEFLGDWSPGLEKVATLFSSEVNSSTGVPVSFFLVGGPGSGKSTFAKKLIRSLGHEFPSQGISNLRSMNAPIGRGIIFVNDASIKRPDGSDSLIRDMLRAQAEDSHLLVCANRGVFADELNGAFSRETSSQDQVLTWLAQTNMTEELEGFDVLASTDYLKIARITGESGSVRIVAAIYMDVCSLLESSVKVEINDLGWDGVKATNQQLGSITSEDQYQYRLESPLGNLLVKVAATISSATLVSDFNVDPSGPIAANADSLGNPGHIAGLLQLLRIAEINSGTKLNYRAFWSLLTRYIFGPLVDEASIETLQTSIEKLDKKLSDSDSFEVQLLGASYRSPASLFSAFSSSPQDPSLRFLHAVDPILGGSPEPTLGQNFKLGERTTLEILTDSLQSVENDKTILQLAREQGLTDFVDSLSAFDHNLDSSYRSLLAAGYILEERATQLTSAYARHLVRMLGTYCGSGAGEDEASTWLLLWEASPAIPGAGGLFGKFNSLFKPRMTSSDADSPSLIPLLESKLAPLDVQSIANPKLAVSLDNVSLETLKAGPDLFLTLQELGFEIGRIRVDYSLLREVLSSSGMTHGVTDQSSFVNPRLDRVRGTKLAALRKSKTGAFRLVVGGTSYDAFVGAASE
jgi:DNA polymerase III delta prime subunit